MAIEDFGTYTEVDEDGDITVTAPKCDVSSMRRDANSYVYADKGAAHFGDFEHLITMYLGSSDNSANNGLWGLSNNAHTIQDKATAGSGFRIQINSDVSGNLKLYLIDDGAGVNDFMSLSAPVTYYLTIERASTALTCKVYSDAARNTLVDTLSVTCLTTTFQHIETIQSRDANGTPAASMTYYVESLDLQEAKPRSWGVIF